MQRRCDGARPVRPSRCPGRVWGRVSEVPLCARARLPADLEVEGGDGHDPEEEGREGVLREDDEQGGDAERPPQVDVRHTQLCDRHARPHHVRGQHAEEGRVGRVEAEAADEEDDGVGELRKGGDEAEDEEDDDGVLRRV